MLLIQIGIGGGRDETEIIRLPKKQLSPYWCQPAIPATDRGRERRVLPGSAPADAHLPVPLLARPHSAGKVQPTFFFALPAKGSSSSFTAPAADRSDCHYSWTPQAPSIRVVYMLVLCATVSPWDDNHTSSFGSLHIRRSPPLRLLIAQRVCLAFSLLFNDGCALARKQ
jgi:hypothetical protein